MVQVRVLDTAERAGGNRHADRTRWISPGACPASPSRRAGSPPPRRTASMAAGRPARARRSGSSAPSCPASRRTASTGAARRATTAYYVREREWEAAHTVWLWIDRSASMGYASSLAQAPKIDRALVLGLALADLLVRGGERVGHLGLTNPLASRAIVDRSAEADRGRPVRAADLPPAGRCRRSREAVLIGDFLTPARRVARGHRAAWRRAARAAISCGAGSRRGDVPLRGPGGAGRFGRPADAARRRRRVFPRTLCCDRMKQHRERARERPRPPRLDLRRASHGPARLRRAAGAGGAHRRPGAGTAGVRIGGGG